MVGIHHLQDSSLTNSSNEEDNTNLHQNDITTPSKEGTKVILTALKEEPDVNVPQKKDDEIDDNKDENELMNVGELLSCGEAEQKELIRQAFTTKEKISGCTTDETCGSTYVSVSAEHQVHRPKSDTMERILTRTISMHREGGDGTAMASTPSTTITNSLKVIIPSDGIVISNSILDTSKATHEYEPKMYTKATTRASTYRNTNNTNTSTTTSTPLGKVVESGQEHTGRWTRDEHEAFLSALRKHGKEWKKVAAKVKTRTVVQTRTHAQKYFQKLQKQSNSSSSSSSGGGANISVDDALMMSLISGGIGKDDGREDPDLDIPKKQVTARRKRSSQQNNMNNLDNLSDSDLVIDGNKGKIEGRITRSNNHMEATSMLSSSSPPPDDNTTKSNRSSILKMTEQPCPVTKAAAELMSKLASATVDLLPSTKTHIVEASQVPYIPPPYVSTDEAQQRPETPPATLYPTHISAPRIRIFPPSQFKAPKSSFYPEPSPAACGKRKLDELTAAQMLAGVMSNPSSATREKLIHDLCIPSIADCGNNNNIITHSSIVDDDTHNSDDDLNTSIPLRIKLPSKQTCTDITTNSASNIVNNNSLSIINPDNLIVQQNTTTIQKRLMRGSNNGPSAPSTPWDGQLEALLLKKQDQNPDQDESKDMELSCINTKENIPQNNTNTTSESFIFHPIQCKSQIKNRSCLHEAICTSSITNVNQVLKSTTATGNSINEQDSMGFTPLHVAACLHDLTIASDITRLLLSYNNSTNTTNETAIDPTLVDKCGNTALHWASLHGNSRVIHLLSLRNCPLDYQNNDGETALHWSMRAGLVGFSSTNVLIEHGSRPNLFNDIRRRPIDVAALGFLFYHSKIFSSSSNDVKTNCLVLEDNKTKLEDNMEEIKKTRGNLLSCSPQSRTLVLHHPECLEHMPKTNRDWEVPDRVIQILRRISPKKEDNHDYKDKKANIIHFHTREITVSQDFDRASLELLSRVHSTEYLAFVNNLSKELERRNNKHPSTDDGDDSRNDSTICGGESSPLLTDKYDNCSVIPFTPMVQRKIGKNIQVKQDNESDTSFSVGSLRAARRAAGAVQHAVDCVLMGRNRNAFCIVRPPGHHAGYEGLLENGESCGFCIFNNVAAGAAHALSDRHRARCERCAIVDIDVHHGNGTQEIVQRFHDPSRLFFFSVHLYDRDSPPNTTTIKQTKKGTATSSSCNYDSSCQKDSCLWKFYPGTGDSDDVASNVINVPIAPLWKENDLQHAHPLNKSSPSINTDNTPIHHNTRHRHKRKAAVVATTSSSNKANIDFSDVSSQTSIISDTPLPDNNTSTPQQHSDNNNTPTSKTSPSPSSNNIPSSSTTTIPPSSPTTNTPCQYHMGIGRKAYRRSIQHRLLPALRAFNPDLILISAGFDAANGDVGNAKHLASEAKRGMDLEPEDYAWTTQKIMEVADICCQGRVVSVLEGGYGYTPTPSTVSPSDDSNLKNNTNQDSLLDKSIFAECAAQHLWAFVDPYNVEKRS